MLQVLLCHQDCRLFKVDDQGDDEFLNWKLDPRPLAKTIPREEGFWLVRAHALPGRGLEACYMNLVLPERINDFLYVLESEKHRIRELRTPDVGAVVVPMLGCEEFGNYELYFPRSNPLGISILRDGLKYATKKAALAQDLGFILRDLGRLAEAADAFSIAIAEGPSSSHIFRERARLRRLIGDISGADQDMADAERLDRTTGFLR